MTKARDIADGVDTADIADGAISTAKLADGSISTAKIADSAISSAKIADGDITDAKLASGISASKLTGALPAVDGSALTGIGGGLKIVASATFNSSGTWTKNADTNLIYLHAIGATGGGAASTTGTYHMGGGGGGAGHLVIHCGGNDLGNTQTVTIGAKGNGASSGASNGNAGGTTTFGNIFTLNGGAGGVYASGNSPSNNLAQAAGGTATVNLSVGGNINKVETSSGGLGGGFSGAVQLAATGGNIYDEGVQSSGGSAYGPWKGRTPNNGVTPTTGVFLFSGGNTSNSAGLADVNIGLAGNAGSIVIQEYGDI